MYPHQYQRYSHESGTGRAGGLDTSSVRETLSQLRLQDCSRRCANASRRSSTPAIGLAAQGTAARIRDPHVRQHQSDLVDDLQRVITEIRTAIFDLHGGDTTVTRLRQRLDDAVHQPAATGITTEIRGVRAAVSGRPRIELVMSDTEELPLANRSTADVLVIGCLLGWASECYGPVVSN